ncbi:uncharacterized protein LOC107265807 [Cephus cinctus]|uniref:Uncharacterized protein LOC107265807 n=1 Tax=Cephus cinctus TaxID=211228 RepID=A0AAJ7FGT7_CEPCN|nr:uncharacterized protein LOC107265807 [Cephus cinctus]
MTCSKLDALVLVTLLLIVSVECGPKYDGGDFAPSPSGYMKKSEKAQDQIAMASQVRSESKASTTKRGSTDANEISDRNQEPRFGFTNIGGTGTGYGVSSYAPAKIDLGGVLLGAVIGVGSILIIPKLLYVLSGSYGAYARSEDGSISQTMTRLDDKLAQFGIDTTSCMQRVVCTYAQQAAAAVNGIDNDEDEEKISSFDKIVNTITTNQMFHTAMQGTAVQEAVEAGRSGKSCGRVYHHCGFSMETMLALLANAATVFTTPTARPTAPSAPL